jgi:hypothetical protein
MADKSADLVSSSVELGVVTTGGSRRREISRLEGAAGDLSGVVAWGGIRLSRVSDDTFCRPSRSSLRTSSSPDVPLLRKDIEESVGYDRSGVRDKRSSTESGALIRGVLEKGIGGELVEREVRGVKGESRNMRLGCVSGVPRPPSEKFFGFPPLRGTAEPRKGEGEGECVGVTD